MVFLEPFSAITNLKHDTWPFLWMLNVVEKADDPFSARVNNVKREPGVFALLWSVLSHLIQQISFLLKGVLSCFPPVPDSYPSFATLQLVEDGAQLLSINLSGRTVSQSRPLGESLVFTPPTCSTESGLKGKWYVEKQDKSVIDISLKTGGKRDNTRGSCCF